MEQKIVFDKMVLIDSLERILRPIPTSINYVNLK